MLGRVETWSWAVLALGAMLLPGTSATGGPFAWNNLLQQHRHHQMAPPPDMDGESDDGYDPHGFINDDGGAPPPASPRLTRNSRATYDRLDDEAEAADLKSVGYEEKAREMEEMSRKYEAKAQELKEEEAISMRKKAQQHARSGKDFRAKAITERRRYKTLAEKVGRYAELASQDESQKNEPTCRDICTRDTTCLVECRVCEYNCDRHDATDTFETIPHCIAECHHRGLAQYGNPDAVRHWKARIGSPEFKDFDADGNGQISRSEAAALRKDLGLTYPEMKDIFDAADQNQDNQISQEEWQQAGMQYVPPEHEDIDFDHYGKETKQVSAVGPLTFDFAALDADKDGRISKDEVASYIDNWVGQVRSTALTLFDNVDMNHDGYLTREEFEKAGQNYDEDNLGGELVDNSRMVQQMDKDADGTVCADEAAMRMSPSQRKAFFKYFDINHDGCVTPKELSSAPTFEQLDTDGDGKISLEEAECFGTQLGVSVERMAKLMAEVDTNGDGSLSREEFKNAGLTRSSPDLDDKDNLAEEMEQQGAKFLQVRRNAMLSRHRKRWPRRSN